MVLREKSWPWKLTYPFAHANCTTVGETVYHPKGKLPSTRTLRHEEIHIQQQKDVGILKFLALYLLALPVLFNPWRYKWELEAFLTGSRTSPAVAKRILRSYKYGWLRN